MNFSFTPYPDFQCDLKLIQAFFQISQLILSLYHIEKFHITLSISIYLFPMGVSFSVQGVSFSVQAFSCTLYPAPKLGVGTPFFAR